MSEDVQGTVLVVEDDAELRFVLQAHLHAVGFRVLQASDGAAAVGIAREQVPDVIIMDIGLPVLDGLQATRMLQADPVTAHIPIVILTAAGGKEDVVKGLEAGAQEYLPKPFDIAELLARVRTVHRLAKAHKDLDHLNSQLEAEVRAKTHRLQCLYEFMRDLNYAHTRDEVLDLIVQCVRKTTGAGRISVFLLDVRSERLVCERALGMDASSLSPIPVSELPGVTGKVFQSGKGLAARTLGGVEGGDGYASDEFVSVPLATDDGQGVSGVLNATDKADGKPFREEEIECIRSIAHAGAKALEDILRRTRLQRSVRILLQTLGLLAEYRDDETNRHLERVAQMVRILARRLQQDSPYASCINDEYVEMLVQAAPMHDIGKVGIPDDILTKPDKLTDEEFQIMKTHTEIGRRVLSKALDPELPIPLLEMCVEIAHCHHERFDGRGYPRRIAGKEIPLSARIVALV
ncbi:MAG: response regulator, partial [Planctomycetota bacterium]